MKSASVRKRKAASASIFLNVVRFIFLASALASTCVANAQSAVFQYKNIELSGGCVQLGRSGSPLFHDAFETSDKWLNVNNYTELLDIDFGKEHDGVKTLFITRTKESDPNAEFPNDSAWNIFTGKKSLEGVRVCGEFVLRFETMASKKIDESSNEGGYHSGITWFDANGEKIATTLTPIATGVQAVEQVFSGVIPEGAVFYEIQLGFDIPNIEIGEWFVVRSLSFESIDNAKSYILPGEFVSGIFENGPISWDADLPEGTKIVFQASSVGLEGKGELGAFTPFVGPDGTTESYFDEPFEVSGDFVRYRVVLVPNGTDSPVLKGVNIGQMIDNNWTGRGVFEMPRVKLVGEYSKPSTKRDAPVEIEIVSPVYINDSTVSVTLDDVDVSERFTYERTAPGVLSGRGVLEDELSEGLHRLVIEASDITNRSIVATRCFLVGEAADSPHIALRDDGVTLIDGEPFFPIGIYGVCEREFNHNDIDEAFRGLKEAGFNFAHSYSMPREDKFLRAAEKYGFKLWSVARFPDERFVEVERHSPAIIAWYLGDDTSYNTTPSELYDYFDSCKAVDPNRLTVQADPIDSLKSVSNYRPYVKGTDAFLPEIYPVKNDGDEAGWDCVAQTVADVKRSFSDAVEANDGPKAIWPIIQYFQGWGWKRFPTYSELRGMSFAALAAGANGITWYTYGGFVEPEKKKFNYGVTTTPERWENISKIATQINELSPALLEVTDQELQPVLSIVDGPESDRYGNSSVVYLLKRHDNENYLIVVNSAHESVEFQLELPDARDVDSVDVLYDEKDIATPSVSEGRIQERIEGFGVRVYHW